MGEGLRRGPAPNLSADLELALRLADTADAISLARFRALDLVVETKQDQSPVTEADREVEAELRAILAQERAEDAILGEEEGELGSGRRRWVIDPIDGTRNYARGVPVWATLLALAIDGRLEAAVVSAPALGRRWWAARGEGAYANGERIRVSAVARLEDASLSVALGRPVPPRAREAWHLRALGDFWQHVLVAEGALDGAIDELGVTFWDLAAVQLVVEEAGGRFTDAEGVARSDGGSAVSSNGHLHELLLGLHG